MRDGGKTGRIITGAGNMPSLRSIHATCRHSVYDHFRSSIFIYPVRTSSSHFNSRYIRESRERETIAKLEARAGTLPLIQRDLQLLQWYGHKVVQQNRPRGQLRFALRRHQLSNKVRSHRKLCYHCQQCARQGVISHSPSRVKLKRGGKSLPFGILAPSCFNSSKNGCTMASTALSLAPGVYSKSLDTKSMASCGVRGRKTLGQVSMTP